MPLIILSVLLQIVLVVHVMRTGRPTYWVYLIIFVPAVGSVAYVVAEILPELFAGRRARGTMRKIRKTLDPDGDLRQYERVHKLSGSVDAARKLADELVSAGRHDEAIQHYRDALTGLYEHDPDLMLGLARAQFGKKEFAEARDTLDALRDRNPEYRSSEGHLLYARSNEQCGELQKAEEEYRALVAYYPGSEARLCYAQLLERMNRSQQALSVYEELVSSAELAPRHYRRAQKEWIDEARSSIRRLRS